MTARLVLASASPRRAQILEEHGLEFEVLPSGVDEAGLAALPVRRHAMAAAAAKARAVAVRRQNAWVIGADTVVAVDGTGLGKPVDTTDAVRMLQLLSGRTHSVISAVSLVSPQGVAEGLGITRVRFEQLSDARIRDFVASGEPVDKAGAYAIQGGAAEFASIVRGRLDTVVGLPTHVLFRLLRETGYRPAKTRSANLGRLR